MTNNEVPQFSRAQPKLFYGYIVVAVSSFILVVIYGMNFAFGVFFNPMLNEFGWTRAIISGASSLSWIVHGLLSIVMGRLNDRFGPRVVITICGAVLGLGYLLMSQVNAIWQLYLFYGVIIGTGLSGAFVPLTSTVVRWFVEKRTMMTGIVVAGAGIGGLMVPPMASHLISNYDWRISYILLGGLSLVVIILLAQLLRRDPTQIGCKPYGVNQGEEQDLKSEPRAFSFREAVKTRQLWIVIIMIFSLGYCGYTIMVHIVPHAIDLEISATNAANILATVGGMSVVGRVVLGGAADRIGNKNAFIIGFILMAIAVLWLIPATSLWSLYMFAIVFGFAFGGCVASESPLVAWLFGLSSHGMILGLVSCGFSVGAAVGPLVTGHMFDVTGNYQASFLLTAAVVTVGAILTALLRPTSVGLLK